MIRALTPPTEAAAWDIVVSSGFREANEDAARPAVNWLHTSGPVAGVRVPHRPQKGLLHPKPSRGR
eukprot:6514769-Alexandrium_andersonii.AAC.1